jgi:hypothetical protein
MAPEKNIGRKKNDECFFIVVKNEDGKKKK